MPKENAMSLFHYMPNKSLAVISMLGFALLSVFFFARTYKTKSANFLYVIPVAAFGESISFLYRILNINNPTLARFITMSLFSMLVPIVLPLANYMAVGSVIKHSNIPTTQFFLTSSFVSWFFFGSDVTFFWLERLGELNTTASPNSLGMAIYTVITSLQSMSFAAFIFIAIYVHQNPNYTYQIKGVPNAKSRLMLCVYTTSVFQYVRYIYRATEYATGFDAALNKHEWFFYIFDTLMVASCFATYSILFMGNYLPRQCTDSKNDGEYIRVSDLDDEDLDNMIAEGKKHVAVFNNVQKVNYSISVDP